MRKNRRQLSDNRDAVHAIELVGGLSCLYFGNPLAIPCFLQFGSTLTDQRFKPQPMQDPRKRKCCSEHQKRPGDFKKASERPFAQIGIGPNSECL